MTAPRSATPSPAVIASNDKLRYLYVQADTEFFEYLTRDTDILWQDNNRASIDIYKCWIGLTVTGITLLDKSAGHHLALSIRLTADSTTA